MDDEKLRLPEDLVLGREFSADTEVRVTPVGARSRPLGTRT